MIDLYTYYREFAERKGLPWIDPAPLVNEVDHRAFNYSLEEPILREFGTFLGITHYHELATIQPCIRGGDISRIKRKETLNHLALFHIFPLTFSLLPDAADLERYHRRAIAYTLEFLEGLALDLGKLKITYFAGGRLDEISAGKVPVSKYFPEDSITREAFLDAGLTHCQLEAVASLDTFVATFIGEGEFYAGNRYEIYYRMPNEEYLEVGTGEALAYRQVCSGGKTVEVVPYQSAVSPIVLGFERMQAVLENRANVLSISNVQNLADTLSGSGVLNEVSCCGDNRRSGLEAANYFRAAHAVLSQTHNQKLNRSMSARRRVILSQLCGLLRKTSIGSDDFMASLLVNAEIHPWLPELKSEIETVADLLVQNVHRRSLLQDS